MPNVLFGRGRAPGGLECSGVAGQASRHGDSFAKRQSCTMPAWGGVPGFPGSRDSLGAVSSFPQPGPADASGSSTISDGCAAASALASKARRLSVRRPCIWRSWGITRTPSQSLREALVKCCPADAAVYG